MTVLKGINIPVNRVEGDLEVLVDIADGVITEARCSGTMFRGFEELMQGRSALDGLVITPRVCGICSLTHLNAAAEALDAISCIDPPDNARRLRNVALMAEIVQNDLRQTSLMFMVDFAQREAYEGTSFYNDALFRYDPLKGAITQEVIKETKKMLKIVAIIGGQWPHTSFMVPGGVVSTPDSSKLMQCKMIVRQFRTWYEQKILGCSLETWQTIRSVADLDAWLAADVLHRESEVGFLLGCLRETGIGGLGRGPNRFLSYGNFSLPEDTEVEGPSGRYFAPGYAESTSIQTFDQTQIREDLSHSWFRHAGEPDHPSRGQTIPGDGPGKGGRGYSWIKAPRYDGRVVETGALAEMIVDANPLFVDMLNLSGPNVLIRQLARLVRPVRLLPAMQIWLDELVSREKESFYTKVGAIPDGAAVGLIQAARGALGHWVDIRDNRIARYQIITPTAWNGSPKDSDGNRGAWEQALVGTPVKDPENPIEAGHIIRSYDPCLVCAVHTVKKR